MNKAIITIALLCAALTGYLKSVNADECRGAVYDCENEGCTLVRNSNPPKFEGCDASGGASTFRWGADNANTHTPSGTQCGGKLSGTSRVSCRNTGSGSPERCGSNTPSRNCTTPTDDSE